MYQIRLVCQSSPTVVTAYAHHAVVYKEIHRGNGLRVGEVAMIGLGGAWSAVFYGVAAVETFQRIIGHVHLESAVGYKEQAFFCLAGECTPIYVCPVIVFLRADVGFVHVFDVRGVFTEELRSAAVAVVFFRTASVVGQRSDACGKLHAQSHARYHWRLGIFGYEVVVHFDNAVAVHLVCNVPAGIGLWKAVGHFYCCGVLAPHNVEVFGFRFLIACFFPCFQSYGKPGSIIVVDRCTPEEGAGTLSIMDKFLFLVSVGYQQAALLVECGCEVCTGEGELSAIIFRSGKCLPRSVFLMESIDIGLLAGNDCACRKERFGGTDGSIEFNAYVSG